MLIVIVHSKWQYEKPTLTVSVVYVYLIIATQYIYILKIKCIVHLSNIFLNSIRTYVVVRDQMFGIVIAVQYLNMVRLLWSHFVIKHTI